MAEGKLTLFFAAFTFKVAMQASLNHRLEVLAQSTAS